MMEFLNWTREHWFFSFVSFVLVATTAEALIRAARSKGQDDE